MVIKNTKNMEKKINLEEILRNKIGYLGNEPNLTKLISERAIGSEILNAMKESCKQILELASENVEIEDITAPQCDDHTPFRGACCSCGRYDNPEILIGHKVNKQSILDTIKQVE